jgi:hypothetical protein
MYILKSLAGILSAAKERVVSVGGSWGQSSASNERIPLISDDEGYPSSMDREHTGDGDPSRQQQHQHELRGLSAEYVNWFESTTAAKYAVGNFAAYLLVAVVGYSFVFEDWAVHDSVYFAMVVFTTVGMWWDQRDEERGMDSFSQEASLNGYILNFCRLR